MGNTRGYHRRKPVEERMAKTKVLKIDPASPDRKIIQFAAALLRSGGLVAFPTETVYGIGVNFLDKKAVEINRLPST